MSETTTLKILVHANADLTEALLSRAAGGAHLDAGIAERISSQFGTAVEVAHEPAHGFGALHAALQDGSAPMLGSGANIVVLSLADDINALPDRGETPEAAVHSVRESLVGAIQLIKEKMGAHILVANHSTVDPSGDTFNYQGVSPEPISLRIQRLDLMLIGVSHEEGISIIDVDRKVAELGAGGNVPAPMTYGPAAAEVIADETVRVLEDYGFFDDRPLLAQVGAKGSKA